MKQIDIKVVYLRQYTTLSPDGRDKVIFYVNKKSCKIKIKDATL